jgi:hypothetical protein
MPDLRHIGLLVPALVGATRWQIFSPQTNLTCSCLTFHEYLELDSMSYLVIKFTDLEVILDDIIYISNSMSAQLDNAMRRAGMAFCFAACAILFNGT